MVRVSLAHAARLWSGLTARGPIRGSKLKAMDLYARVNILGGRAVRLARGDLAAVTALDADPLARARGWIEKGADYLHIVDLDAAANGDYQNRSLIDHILREIDVPVVVGGGIRSEPEAERLIKAGAWKIVMGTAAIEHQNMVWDLCRKQPERIIVSLDVLDDEQLLVRGWTENSGRYLEEVLVEMSSAGVWGFFISEGRRDTLNEAPNFAMLTEALGYVDAAIIASGGVRNLEDLQAMSDIRHQGRGLAGVVVGREVTEGRFTIEQAQAVLVGEGLGSSDRIRQMHTALHVTDLDACVEFYEGALSFRRIRAWHETGNQGCLLEASDGRLVELRGGAAGAPHGVALAFMVDDPGRTAQRLADQGVTCGPLVDSTWGTRSFEVVDPEGVRIQFFQHKES